MPTPTMPGMVGNCKTFYKRRVSLSLVLSAKIDVEKSYTDLLRFIVASGNNCSVISTRTGASVANTIKWNPQAGSTCNVWLDYYIRVSVEV